MDTLALILSIIGSINWGLVGIFRFDLVAWLSRYIYVLELKLSNNGGLDAAEQQIRDCRYIEPFKGDPRKVVGLAVELDSEGKGLINWKVVE